MNNLRKTKKTMEMKVMAMATVKMIAMETQLRMKQKKPQMKRITMMKKMSIYFLLKRIRSLFRLIATWLKMKKSVM